MTHQLTHAEEGNEETRIVALVNCELAHVEVNVNEGGSKHWTQGVAEASRDSNYHRCDVASVLLPDSLAEVRHDWVSRATKASNHAADKQQ